MSLLFLLCLVLLTLNSTLSCSVDNCEKCSEQLITVKYWKSNQYSCHKTCFHNSTYSSQGYECYSSSIHRWNVVCYDELCYCEKIEQLEDWCDRCNDGFKLNRTNGQCEKEDTKNSELLTHLTDDRKITELTWIGAHNAGAYKLRFLNTLSHGIRANIDDHHCGNLNNFHRQFGEAVLKRGSENQHLSIYDQLLNGIRFFDLDICEHDNIIRTCHCLWGNQIQVFLQDIRTWLTEISNNNEIIIIQFSDGSHKNSTVEKLVVLVEYYLKDYLYNLDATNWPPTVGDLLSKNQRVLILWKGHTFDRRWQISAKKYSRGSYAHTTSFNNLVKHHIETCKKFDTIVNKNYFNFIHWYYTIDSTTIILNLFTKTLLMEEKQRKLHEQLTTVLKSDNNCKRANVILGDFVDANFVSIIKKLKS